MGFNYRHIYLIVCPDANGLLEKTDESEIIDGLRERGFVTDHHGRDFQGGDGVLVYAKNTYGKRVARCVQDTIPTLEGSLEDIAQRYLSRPRVFPQTVVTSPDLGKEVQLKIAGYRHRTIHFLKSSKNNPT